MDFTRGKISCQDTKNGSTGRMKMNATTRALLESLPKPINRSQYVFPEYHEAKNGPTWLVLFNRAWKRASKKAGISDFRFHDLRHQAATDLLTLGADLNDVRDFLRHKSMTMTLRYAHLVKARRSRTAHLLDSMSVDSVPGEHVGK